MKTIEIPVEYKSRFTKDGIQTIEKGQRFPRKRIRKKKEKYEKVKSKNRINLLRNLSNFLSLELDQSDPNEYPQFCLKWCIEIMEKQSITDLDRQIDFLFDFRARFAKTTPKFPVSETAVFIYKNARPLFISFVVRRKISLQIESL